MTEQKEPKPFVKWAGGKRQLLEALLNSVPESFSDYYEPFVGGGALYFKLWFSGRIKKAHLNDSNPELINAYLVIQKQVSELIDELKKSKYSNTKDAFYEIRSEKPKNTIERAARFIYLNKTAFNGLYRVNSKGGFNVPFGKYTNPRILDEENLILVSESLKNVEISCKDFAEAVKLAKKEDFVYFDPPYYPRNHTSHFTKYTKRDFTIEDQERLRDTCAKLVQTGVSTLVSNSDTEVIRELYKDYSQVEVYATRAINCKADERGKITELIINGVRL